MDAFSLVPPLWTEAAVHARGFQCPTCAKSPREAKQVWLNRRSPVYTDDGRKYQEFYQCDCTTVWWAWSTDRPKPDCSSD
ncbi:MAG: hypothetical protein B0A82_20435 [Alkalinema sp. CACIAM 70d]|nr:MAG: hypothetical protein B0A82_20435 [Alkalinema sp. CACIAM 70d]